MKKIVTLTVDEAIRLSRYRAVTFGDDGGYSALHRPGSWEWQLAQAQAAHERLTARGYTIAADPAASWRVQWIGPAPRAPRAPRAARL